MRTDNFRITRTATRITLKQSLNLKGSTYSINSCRRSCRQISVQIAMKEELRIHSELGETLDSNTMRKYLTRGGFYRDWETDRKSVV